MKYKRGRHLAPRLRSISRGWALPFSLAMVLVVSAVAWADTVENNVVAGGNDTIIAGDSTSISYWIQVQGGGVDGQGGCNASDGGAATVTLSVPSGVTASASALSFSACNEGNAKSVTFSSNTPGDYAINVSSITDASSPSGGSYNNQANFTLHVLAPSDTTPPVITPNILGTVGNNGWYTSDVAVSWTVADGESAITSSSGCGPTTISSDTAGVALTCTATSAGGTSTESVTIKRDATAPMITWSNGPLDGASYYYGFVPDGPTCGASDSPSGVTGAGCAVSGYGTAVGSHTMSAQATDLAGNQGTLNRSYTVLAWTLSGFYRPVEMSSGETVWNTVKGGSTVPLKFEVFAGSTELTDTAVIQGFTASKVACEANGSDDPVEFTTTGGTSLRYDWTAGQFVQNWQTPKTAGCYKVKMTTQDGSSISAFLKIK